MRDKFLSFLGLCKKSGNLLEGYNKCEDALKRDSLKLIILSEEVSENTKDMFKRKCEKSTVYIVNKYSNIELGRSIGREEINVLGVTDERMSEKLIILLKQTKN